MDAITLLKNDHKTVEGLFKKFEKTGDGATKTRRDLVDRIIKELAVHAEIEEQVFYPAVRAELPDETDLVLEALEEHHVVKWTLSELDGMPAEHERFAAKVTVLIESVRHHVEEEEGELFPKVRDALGRKVLGEIGDAMETLKKVAPTKPHPRSPDEPPANVLAAPAAALMDKARDAGKEAVSKVTGRGNGTKKKASSRK
jgi:hemerythrin superfamily protein